jgi:hypothetical protein
LAMAMAMTTQALEPSINWFYLFHCTAIPACQLVLPSLPRFQSYFYPDGGTFALY